MKKTKCKGNEKMKPQFCLKESVGPSPFSSTETFRRAEDVYKVKYVRRSSAPELRRGKTVAQAAGIRYETNIQKALKDLALTPRYFEEGDSPLASDYWNNPYFEFYTKSQANPRFCEMDGLWVFNKLRKIVIVEIKLRYTDDARAKVLYLYEPVLRGFIKSLQKPFKPLPWKVSSLVITKTLDPATAVLDPEALNFESIFEALSAPPGSFGVLQWTGSSTNSLKG